MSILERFNKPTPGKWMKIGRSIHLLGTLLQVAFATAGVMTVTSVVSIAVIQWLGASLTDYFTDEQPQVPNENN